jgi:8-hydroxy-5-deazaflavin:NADPH oxidoreductase
MRSCLVALGLMLVGLAKNGAGAFDIALHVDIG